MHAVDERVEIAQIYQLKSIYAYSKELFLPDRRPILIVMVKAPVAGRAKTRLAMTLE